MLTILLNVALSMDLDRLGEAAARLRGLPYRPIPGLEVDLKQAEAELEPWLRARSTPEQDRRWAAFLKVLGLMPADGDPFQARMQLAKDQIRGLYDPVQKRYFVVRNTPGDSAMGVPVDEAVTVHELTHALQDQHYDLTLLRKRAASSFDRAMALECLLEGDANAVMVDYMLETAGQAVARPPSQPDPEAFPLSAVMAGAPRFFREALILPYLQGQYFVETVRLREDWPKVYQQLPESTEQIFHPEKYPTEHPEPVLCQQPAPSGFHSLGRDTAGEFTLRCWALERGASARVAAGWAGDQFEVFDGPPGPCLIWVTRWDTPADAQEFAHFAALQSGSGQTVERSGEREVVLYWNVKPPPARIHSQ